MKTEIEIIDRIYYNIEAFCKTNGKDLSEYMADAVVERYNLDRYGDLNEKMVKKETPKKATTRKTVKKPEIEIEIPKVEEKVQQSVVEEKPTVKIEEKPTIVETVAPTIEEQPKKTRRTLKTR